MQILRQLISVRRCARAGARARVLESIPANTCSLKASAHASHTRARPRRKIETRLNQARTPTRLRTSTNALTRASVRARNRVYS